MIDPGDLRRAFEHAETAQLLLRPDGRVALVSHGYLRSVGLAATQIVGRPIFELPPYAGAEQASSELRAVLAALRERRSASTRLQWSAPCGGFLAASNVPVPDERGEIEHVLHTLHPAAQLPAACGNGNGNGESAQRIESLRALAGGVAHDFNNLLMVIMGSAGLLRSVLGAQTNALSHVSEIEAASRRASELCQKMLTYAGKARLSLQRASLTQIATDALPVLRTTLPANVRLFAEHTVGAPEVMADAPQLQKVLVDLVWNARDALPESGGVITLRTGTVVADRSYLDASVAAPALAEGTYAYVEVSDTGVGMSEQTRSRVFDPFFSTKFAGRGLGLPTVLGVVRGHHGAVHIDTTPGQGSCVRVLLPLAQRTAPQPTPSHLAAANSGAAATLLVVDDESAVRAVTGHMLELLGFRVLCAPGGAEACSLYQQHAGEIAGVLLDLTMPGLDGAATFRQLRLIDPDARVLLMSGYDEQEAVARFADHGLWGFIQKPFALDELEARLQTLFASAPARC